MIYRFDGFELDPAKFELRRDGEILAGEPQVLALLLLLVEHRERLLSKDEIIEHIWEGRIVSDSALASRIKSARRLLGDDGKQQKYIKTLHGKGFRFVGEISNEPEPVPATAQTDTGGTSEAKTAADASRPSIAVLPFRLVGIAGQHAAIAEALPHEIITELSRLRWLFVIARESSFRFRSGGFDLAEASAGLGARYYLSGSVELAGDAMTVTAELADSRDGGIIWAERYVASIGEVHDVRQQIVASIITALEIQIPRHEARQARFQQPESLDAWSAYHLGLEHMYRFTREDNEKAQALFAEALAAEPDFARAHAGMAFTHCTNATSQLVADLEGAAKGAMHHAEEALSLDPNDPFANLCMGRALWLVSDPQGSWRWADRSVQLSPSYAQGLYGRAWPENALGRTEEALASIDLAMQLSPLDPLSSVMRIMRATAHFQRGEKDEAADWAQQGAREPGANGATWAVTAAYMQDAGLHEDAARWAERARLAQPGITGAMLLKFLAFHDQSSSDRFVASLAEFEM